MIVYQCALTTVVEDIVPDSHCDTKICLLEISLDIVSKLAIDHPVGHTPLGMTLNFFYSTARSHFEDMPQVARYL